MSLLVWTRPRWVLLHVLSPVACCPQHVLEPLLTSLFVSSRVLTGERPHWHGVQPSVPWHQRGAWTRHHHPPKVSTTRMHTRMHTHAHTDAHTHAITHTHTMKCVYIYTHSSCLCRLAVCNLAQIRALRNKVDYRPAQRQGRAGRCSSSRVALVTRSG